MTTMFSRILSVFVVALLSTCFCAASSATTNATYNASDRALLILASNSLADTHITIHKLEELGAHAVHVLQPQAIIAQVPAVVESRIQQIDNVSQLYRSSAPVPSDADQPVAKAIQTWNYLLSPTGAPANRPELAIQNDMQLPPDLSVLSTGSENGTPGYNQTSEFMIGSVAVGVVLPESNGNLENWSPERQDEVFNRVVAGLDWWALKGGPGAHLTFYYEKQFGIPTKYEPITMQGVSDCSLWISDVLYNLRGNAEARNYVNYLRTTYSTDWAYTIFVVDSLNDTDGCFQTGFFAWAQLGGPYTVLTYDNSQASVVRHETGHIFLARDEYCQPGYYCCDFSNSGYLGIYNGNCELNNPLSIGCVMKYNSDNICDYTLGQIGWRDTDGDGVFDPVDNPISISSVSTLPLFTADGRMTVVGTASETPCDSPIRTDVTINRIASVKYRVDGGNWLDAKPRDTAFNTCVEDFELTTPVLSPANHVVALQAFSTSGNSSDIFTYTINPAADIYVDQNASGVVHDGKSWQTAYLTITEALTNAVNNDEIWVADGIYTERITLKNGVTLLGGFKGTEYALAQRNPSQNVTVIDGNTEGCVVKAPNGIEQSTVLDGFTIRNGKASNGGGIYCESLASPTICNNVITHNSSTSSGAGIYLGSSGNPILRHNTITNNDTAASGGGVYCNKSSGSISENRITGNTARVNGGGVYNNSASTSVVSNVIANNSAGMGAGIYGYYSYYKVANNTIASNLRTGTQTFGCGCCFVASGPHLLNNIIAYNDSGIYSINGNPLLESNNIYSNGSNDYGGLPAGAGDISQPPLFKDKDAGDYRLCPDSPCVDAGLWGWNAAQLDIDGWLRPQDGNGDMVAVVDMGAHEYPVDFATVRKTYPDGTQVYLPGLVVTASFPDRLCTYVQAADRSGGLRVLTAVQFEKGEIVNVSGTINTSAESGERWVSGNMSPARTGKWTRAAPLGMNIRSMSGGTTTPAEADNVCLLVRVWGHVKSIEPNNIITVEDGSGASVLAVLPGNITPSPLWDYVLVTGISSGNRNTGTRVLIASQITVLH